MPRTSIEDLTAALTDRAAELTACAALVDANKARAEELHPLYADVLAHRQDVQTWVYYNQSRPACYWSAIEAAGKALNAADDAHYALTRTWVPIEA